MSEIRMASFASATIEPTQAQPEASDRTISAAKPQGAAPASASGYTASWVRRLSRPATQAFLITGDIAAATRHPGSAAFPGRRRRRF